MANPPGFLKYQRQMPPRRPVEERVGDFREIYLEVPDEQILQQSSRCMDCGVPFCQSGCPLGNVIPEFNALVHRSNWRAAYERLDQTNNFPEFTGRLCPAPCESACVLGIVEEPVTIEYIEKSIIERAFDEGWVTPRPVAYRSGQRVAVVGSGPAGLAAADQLNRAGYYVTVLERADEIGGLLRYGIPDFKLEKNIIDRRIEIMLAEGITFQTGANVGENYSIDELMSFDAVVLCVGSTRPRDLPIPGRSFSGIEFAWDYLAEQNAVVGAPSRSLKPSLDAKGKNVIVIGGGDTGSDCVGTANRQGAASVTQFELLPMPPNERPEDQPWPYYPMVHRTTSSHEEGVERKWSIMTKAFIDDNGAVKELITVEVERGDDGRFVEREGTLKSLPVDLVLLAIGYVGPETAGPVEQLNLDLDERGNIKAGKNFQTNVDKVFAAGDGRRGQSLIVWAIAEGRQAAASVDAWLKESARA